MQAVFLSLFVLGVVASMKDATTKPLPPLDVPARAGPIDGGYTIVSGERNGEPIPAAEIKGGIVRFTRGEAVGRNQNADVFFAAAYTLDTTKKPWKITMKSIAPEKSNVSGSAPKKALTAVGLVKKEGETVTLIYALPGGEPPTEFKTKANQQMFVLKSFAAGPQPPNKFEGP